MSEKIKRIEKWDILKFFLIFCVVLGHCADRHTGGSELLRSLFVIIYTFHMPLFLFVSGLFSKSMINNKRYDKILSYFVLYVLAKFIDWLLDVIFELVYDFSLWTTGGLPWFMFTLFVYALLTMALKNVSPKYLMTFWIFMACIAGYDSNINDFLCLSRIIVFYPFYYLGYCLNSKKIEEHCSEDKKKKILAAVFIIVVAAVVFVLGDKIYPIRYYFTGRNPYSTIGINIAYGCMLRLFCYALSFLMCYAIILLTPDKLGKGWIARMGKNTLAVYMFHQLLIRILYDCFGIEEIYRLISPDYPGLLVFPVSIILTIALSNSYLTKCLNKISTVQMRKK